MIFIIIGNQDNQLIQKYYYFDVLRQYLLMQGCYYLCCNIQRHSATQEEGASDLEGPRSQASVATQLEWQEEVWYGFSLLTRILRKY